MVAAHDAEHPEWAIAWQEREDGAVVYTDERGERLVALAVTRDELRRLETGLQLLPASAATVALMGRLATLHADLGE